jgi:ubiquinone/menaquinone biosynthesis C-methylase UbiE
MHAAARAAQEIISKRPDPSVGEAMPLDQRQQASLDQFDRQSRNYGTTHILADVGDLAAAIDGVNLPERGRALDVATGGGHTAVWLAKHGWEVTASDLSPAMIERTAELAASNGVAIGTAQHEAERLPYADGTFQILTCRVAAHHFSNPETFVSEAARVLRPGGVFLLIDGSVPDGEAEAAEWIHAVEKFRDPSHGRFLSPGEWSALCRKAGLEILKCGTTPFKQPDLNWYFETAGTSEANRDAVRNLIRSAPPQARRAFRLAEEDGKTVWWWPRLSLVARKG